MNAADRIDVVDQPRVISLGLFCMTRWMINAAGLQRGSLPFDDIFSSLPIVNHCLEDGFADYLDRPNYVRLNTDIMWVQDVFRQKYGQRGTFNHHDMSIDANYEKFQRRVQRFRELDASREALTFLVLHEHQNIFTPELMRLVNNLDRMFGTFSLLAVGFNAPTALVDATNLLDARLRAVSFTPASKTSDGLQFEDEADTRALIRIIREHVAEIRTINRAQAPS